MAAGAVVEEAVQALRLIRAVEGLDEVVLPVVAVAPEDIGAQLSRLGVGVDGGVERVVGVEVVVERGAGILEVAVGLAAGVRDVIGADFVAARQREARGGRRAAKDLRVVERQRAGGAGAAGFAGVVDAARVDVEKLLGAMDRHESGGVAIRRIRVVADVPRRDPDEVFFVGHGLEHRAPRVLIRGDVNHHAVRLGPVIARRDVNVVRPAVQVEVVIHHLGPVALDNGGIFQGAQGDVALKARADRRRGRPRQRVAQQERYQKGEYESRKGERTRGFHGDDGWSPARARGPVIWRRMDGGPRAGCLRPHGAGGGWSWRRWRSRA